MTPSSQYRYDTVKEFLTKLKTLIDEYEIKIKKYRRRITAIDVTVYSVSGIMAGAGIILSSVTMVAPIAVPIAISAVTTFAGIANAITKKISSCSQEKLNDYIVKHQTVSNGYSQLSSLMSSSIDDTIITEDEFSAMVRIYDTAIKNASVFSSIAKLEIVNNNNNDARDSTTSADSRKYHSAENKHDINIVNKP
jgi:hypothetical protein